MVGTDGHRLAKAAFWAFSDSRGAISSFPKLNQVVRLGRSHEGIR
jgi:hypothetical protein